MSTTDLSAPPKRRVRLVQSMYAVRVIAYAYCFVMSGLLAYERGYGTGTYVLLALHFLGLPHLLYQRARHSADPRRAELQHLPFDSLLIGAWIGAFGYPVWYLFSGLLGVTLSNVVNTGVRGFVYSLVAFSIGAAGWGWVNGFAFQPWTSPLLAVLTVGGVFVYTSALGVVVHLGAQRLASIRQKLRENELRFRLITENAGDLIALFDAEGNTLYSSPSYGRYMKDEALPPGADVLDHVHPEVGRNSGRR